MLKTNLRRVSNSFKYRSIFHKSEYRSPCSLQCRRILGGRNLVHVRVRIVVAAIFDFMTLEEGRKNTLLLSLPADSPPLPTPFDLPHFLLSSGSFNMALSRAKTFARPKKTPALQTSHHDTNKCIALKVSASPNPQLPKCSVSSRRICVVWWFIDGAASDQNPWTVVCHLCYTRPLKCFLAICDF